MYQHIFKITERIGYPETNRRIQWKTLQLEQHPICRYCAQKVSAGAEHGWLEATVDHVKPLSQGGRDTESNYVIACRACNQSKGSGKFSLEKRSQLLAKRPHPVSKEKRAR